jgi:hypothetical protein
MGVLERWGTATTARDGPARFDNAANAVQGKDAGSPFRGEEIARIIRR